MGVVGVAVGGVPVVLGHVADAGGLGRADGHVVDVAQGVEDGGHVIAAAAGDEVGLTPGGVKGTGGGLGGGGLGPADLRVLLEGDDLAGAGGEGEGQGRGDGGDGGAEVGLDAIGAAEGLVPDNDGHGAGRRVDEVVGVVVAVSRGDLDDVGALGTADVANLCDLRARGGGGLTKGSQVVGQTHEALEERGSVGRDGVEETASRAAGGSSSRCGCDLGVDGGRSGGRGSDGRGGSDRSGGGLASGPGGRPIDAHAVPVQGVPVDTERLVMEYNGRWWQDGLTPSSGAGGGGDGRGWERPQRCWRTARRRGRRRRTAS